MKPPPEAKKPKQCKHVELEAPPSHAARIEKFVRLLQPWCEFFPPWMWIAVPLDHSLLPLETTTGHHDAFTMKGINQLFTSWYEDPWLGPTQSVVGPQKGLELQWCQCGIPLHAPVHLPMVRCGFWCEHPTPYPVPDRGKQMTVETS
jgi:hypothetical protein